MAGFLSIVIGAAKRFTIIDLHGTRIMEKFFGATSEHLSGDPEDSVQKSVSRKLVPPVAKL